MADFYDPPNIDDGDTPGEFLQGDAAQGQKGSHINARMMTAINNESKNLIEGAGLVLDDSNLGQWFEAVGKMISAAAPTLLSEAFVIPATFAGGVTVADDGKPVYYDEGNSNFDLALHPTHNPVGIADVTNGNVYIAGKLPDNLVTGLTTGKTYYLSDAVAGDLTDTAPATDPVEIGVAMATNILNVDIEKALSRVATNLVPGIIQLATSVVGKAGTDTAMAITSKVLLDVFNDWLATDVKAGTLFKSTAERILTQDSQTHAITEYALNRRIMSESLNGLGKLGSTSVIRSGSDPTALVTAKTLDEKTATTTRYGGVKKSTLGGKSGLDNAAYMTYAQVQKLIDSAVTNFKTEVQINALMEGIINEHLTAVIPNSHIDSGGS